MIQPTIQVNFIRAGGEIVRYMPRDAALALAVGASIRLEEVKHGRSISVLMLKVERVRHVYQDHHGDVTLKMLDIDVTLLAQMGEA